MTEQLSIGHKLAHNVGLIVLASQGLEKHLKLVVAASGDEASSWKQGSECTFRIRGWNALFGSAGPTLMQRSRA